MHVTLRTEDMSADEPYAHILNRQSSKSMGLSSGMTTNCHFNREHEWSCPKPNHLDIAINQHRGQRCDTAPWFAARAESWLAERNETEMMSWLSTRWNAGRPHQMQRFCMVIPPKLGHHSLNMRPLHQFLKGFWAVENKWPKYAQVFKPLFSICFDYVWLFFYHISTFGASNSSRSVGQWPKIPRTSHWVRDFNHAYKRLYMEVSINGGTPIYGWFISWKILL